MAFVAAGVLPLDQVAGENLAPVAKEIFSWPLYVFFIVCGAGFALISTMNSQFAWAPKPTMQACDDGWLPAGLARLSRWNTPVALLGILYALGAVCILTGLSVAVLGNMALIASGMMQLIINVHLWKLPRIVPDEWAASKFRLSPVLLAVLTVISSLAAVLMVFLNATTLSRPLQLLNLVVIAGAFIFAFLRSRHVRMDVSYEKV